MRQMMANHMGTLLAAVLTAAGLLVLALSVVGWNSYGSSILLTYAEAGLSWCF